MSLTIFLFDVDGVLIHPLGYKEALRQTVEYVAGRMGLSGMMPTYDDIAVFEACSITSEWDSAPMCVGMILAAALRASPTSLSTSLEATFDTLREARLSLVPPDYQAMAHHVTEHTPDGDQPTHTILGLLRQQLDPAHRFLLDAFLPHIWTLDSYTTRIFQQYTLGSERFTRSSSLPADFESPSMLVEFDVPVLSSEMKSRLATAYEAGQVRYSIYTARPSLPPADLPPGSPVPTTMLFPPEGDLAAEQAGLSHTPLIAGGRVGWLSILNGKTPGDYLKPSPVQALAAIAASLTGHETDSLHAAAALVESSTLSPVFAALANQPVRVVVFEDLTGGILAARRAVDLLRPYFPSITFVAVGIATEDAKRAALTPHVTHLATNINEALSLYLP